MRGVDLQSAGDELLTIRRRRNPRAAILPGVGLVAWLAGVVLLGPTSLYGMISIGVGLGFLPWVWARLSAALRTFEVTLSHNPEAVLVDGEPLEAARVETRVVCGFFTRDPKGYALSLWVLFTEGGSRDVELGRFRTLLEVSQASWTIEAFLAQASIKSKPASTVR